MLALPDSALHVTDVCCMPSVQDEAQQAVSPSKTMAAEQVPVRIAALCKG
jgi:hypothetical protein